MSENVDNNINISKTGYSLSNQTNYIKSSNDDKISVFEQNNQNNKTDEEKSLLDEVTNYISTSTIFTTLKNILTGFFDENSDKIKVQAIF